MEFLETISFADRVAFGALIVSVFSLIYAYRSARDAKDSYRLAREAHEENRRLDRLVRRNAFLSSLGVAKKNYIEAMSLVADSLIILDKLGQTEGIGELEAAQREIEDVVRQLDEYFKKAEEKTDGDAAHFEGLLVGAKQMEAASESRKVIEHSRYRHIFRDLQDATGQEYAP